MFISSVFENTDSCLGIISTFVSTHYKSYTNFPSMVLRMLTRALWLFAFICLLCSPTYSTAVPRNSNIYRQAIEPPIHPVLGVRGLGIDTTHPRLEIRELERNKDQFNVYLLGLQRLQNIPQDDKFSYYQVAGRFFWLGEVICSPKTPLRTS